MPMTQNEFFEILGYLAAVARVTKLDIETHPRRRQSVEFTYNRHSGVTPIPDAHNYYVWDEGTNKWGSELRIYFRGDDNRMPSALRTMTVTPRQPSFGYDFRVNDNVFVWDLIEYGFRLGDSQDIALIRSKVDPQYFTDFNNGLAIP